MLNRLEMIRIFCTAADTGSFKEAATRLGISPQAVTRAVKELEELQGELLFHRNTRQVQITAYGASFAERARVSVAQLDELFDIKTQADEQEISGLVRLAAPAALGRKYVLPIIARLAEEHPGLQFDLRFSDQRSDVVSEKIDIGIRVGFVRDNRFVVRKLGKTHFYVVATPKFLRKHGRPAGIDDLMQLPLTGMLDRGNGRVWPWIFSKDRQMVPTSVQFVSDDSEAEYEITRRGLAIGQIASFFCEEALASGKLIRVMEDFEPEPWDTYLYRPQRGPMPPRLRLVFDTLIQALSGK